MSDIINQAYDEMELEEVICRLPSEFAIGSIQRRLKGIKELTDFFRTRDAGGASKVDSIKSHINNIIFNTSIEDIFKTITPEYHPTLFGWIDDKNKNRILDNGKSHLTVEFIFNLTEPNDLNGMQYILDRVLSDQDPKISKILSILDKIDSEYFQNLIETVIKDARPKIRSSILSTYGRDSKLLSDHQKMIALKAFAKIPASEKGSRHIQPIDFKLFKNLKPLERIMALDRYLNYFKKYRKQKVFDPAPTEDEFNLILFAGCFQYNDLIEDMVKRYNAITKEEDPDKSSS
jgi:hypothetical protein